MSNGEQTSSLSFHPHELHELAGAVLGLRQRRKQVVEQDLDVAGQCGEGTKYACPNPAYHLPIAGSTLNPIQETK